MKKRESYACMLLINDIHLSKDNISDFQKNWDEALRICTEHSINTLVVGGDLWQSRTGQTLSTLMAAREAVLKAAQMNIYIILEPGNHDKVDQESILSYSHIFSEYPNVDVIDDYAGYDVSDKTILWLISYFPENGSFVEKINEVIQKLPSNKTNILYCHEGINGALTSSSDKELATSIFKPFDKVLVGHYHDRTTLDDGRIEYIGASRQHNYGEDENKGYTILYSDGTTKFVQNRINVRYKTITVSPTDLESAKSMLQQTCSDQTKVRLKITCTADEAANIDKNLLMELGASKVEVSTETILSYAKVQDLNTKFNKEGLKEEYSRFCIQKEFENMEMGLKYLDKIDDSCGN